MSQDKAHYPQQVPIDAYGNNGFRFAEMSHKGSMLALPSGMYGWSATAIAELTIQHFGRIFDEKGQIGFVLLGTGMSQVWPDAELRRQFDEAGIGLDVMDTGAAVRTYNVLLAEKRPVAAALVAVER
ncbi:MAG: Mth938-like domain-containing protein [Aestuariivirgaceae bacterium]